MSDSGRAIGDPRPVRMNPKTGRPEAAARPAIFYPYPTPGDYVIRTPDVSYDNLSRAGQGLSINTRYKVLHRQPNGLLTLEGYLLVVGEDQVKKVS